MVVAQGTYLLHVYVPLPPPRGDTFGLERWRDAHQGSQAQDSAPAHRPGSAADACNCPSRRRKNVLIIGDSLVVGIGCKDSMVLPQSICRQLSDRLGVDISWRAVGVNGGDVRTIQQEVLDTVRRFQRDREIRYREYLERVQESSIAHVPLAPQTSSEADGESLAVQDQPASRKLKYRYSVVQQTPPHLLGAGAALFDFVRSYYPKLAEGGHVLARGEDALGGFAGETALAVSSRADGCVLSSEPSPTVDAVIVLCGLNDLKRILQLRTSGVFRADLNRLVSVLRQEVGDECLVILPAMPMEQTNLPEPIRTAMVQLSYFYDLRKAEVATESPLTHYIPKPALDVWARAKERHGDLTAQDRVHPNERGYQVFADFLGQEIAVLFRDRSSEVARQINKVNIPGQVHPVARAEHQDLP